MIVEYSYDNAMEVLDLLKQSQIATLEVRNVEGTGYVMEYTTLSEYSDELQTRISRTLRNGLAQRINLMNVFNQFIEKEALNEVKVFSVSMDANRDVIKCTLTHSFTGTPITPASSVVTLKESLEKISVAVTNMGATDLQTAAYKREGTGRNRKYVQLTLGDLVSIIREALKDEVENEEE